MFGGQSAEKKPLSTEHATEGGEPEFACEFLLV